MTCGLKKKSLLINIQHHLNLQLLEDEETKKEDEVAKKEDEVAKKVHFLFFCIKVSQQHTDKHSAALLNQASGPAAGVVPCAG